MVSRYLSEHDPSEEVFYRIEAGGTGGKEGKAFLRRLYNDPALRKQYRLGGSEFIPKDDPNGLPLRAADLLVWAWQRNHREIEIEEERNVPDSGWNEPFRLLLGNENTPPICYSRLGVGQLRTSAIRVAFHGLHRDNKDQRGSRRSPGGGTGAPSAGRSGQGSTH